MTQFLLFDIDDAQFAYARCVNQPPAIRQQDHFGKGGGMPTLVRPIRYRSCPHFCRRMDGVDKRGFPDAGMADHECRLLVEKGTDRLDVYPLKRDRKSVV